jgi:hypothetical protein
MFCPECGIYANGRKYCPDCHGVMVAVEVTPKRHNWFSETGKYRNPGSWKKVKNPRGRPRL